MKSLAPFAGWTALILGFAALIAYLFMPEVLLWSLTFAIVAGVNAIFFFVVARKEVVHALKTRTALYGMNATVVIFVFLGILIFINLLTHRHKFSWDLTETSFFTLSPQTRKIVEHLPRKVKITAFYQTTDPRRAPFERLADSYMELTDKIEMEFVDPIQKPAIANRFNVTFKTTNDFAIVLQSGQQETKIKQDREEDLTNALLQVTRDHQKKIYFLGGHKEKSIESPDGSGYSQAKKALERDHFKVEELLLLKTGTVPDDADALIINGPQTNLQDSEIQAVDAYLNGGGAVMLLLDPQKEVGLTGFLEGWGIEIRDDLIIDLQSKLFKAEPYTVIVSSISVHDLTRQFNQPAIFQLLRSVSEITTEGLKTQEILFSGQQSWAEKGYKKEFKTGKVHFDPGIDVQGPVPVAVISSKEIKAGDVGKPKTDPSGKSQPAEPPAPSKKAHLVVIGDSDFASNQFFSLYGNSDFFLNSASWLSKEENLISIRPRSRKWSPIILTEMQGNLAFMLGMIGFPGLVVLLGLRVWWKRRSL